MLRRTPSALGALAAAALLSGCAGDAAPPTLDVTVDTVAGVPHVRNPAEAPAWVARETVRIGTTALLEGAPAPDEFGRVRAVVADEEGRIYVADATTAEVRVFGPGGAFERTIGSEGQGPGELTSAYAVGWVGDTLAVFDGGGARVNLYDPDGTYLDQIRTMNVSGGEWFVRIAPGGWIPAPTPQGGPLGRAHRARILGGVAGADTLPVPRAPDSAPPSGILCRFSNAISFYTISFAPTLASAPDPTPPGAHAVAWTATYAVARLDTRGDTLRVVHRTVPTHPVSDAEWAAGMAEYEAREETHGNPGDCEPASVTRPDRKPPIHRLHFDHEGRLIVERNTADGTAYDLYDAEGRIRGTVPAPPHRDEVPPFFRNDHVYLVEVDSLDVPRVVGYRLVPAEPD
ncbi:MAG: 6-bladed beta-propeller [Longimicrobiales bacterium]